jgi:hypothetical protein
MNNTPDTESTVTDVNAAEAPADATAPAAPKTARRRRTG